MYKNAPLVLTRTRGRNGERSRCYDISVARGKTASVRRICHWDGSNMNHIPIGNSDTDQCTPGSDSELIYSVVGNCECLELYVSALKIRHGPMAHPHWQRRYVLITSPSNTCQLNPTQPALASKFSRKYLRASVAGYRGKARYV